jgi:hypothetical protein
MKKTTLISSLLAIGLLLAGIPTHAADGDLIVNGKVGIGTTAPGYFLQINSGATPTGVQMRITANNAGSLSFLTYAADNAQIGFDQDYTGNGVYARSTSAARIIKANGYLQIQGDGNLTPNGAYDPITTRMSIDLTTGNVGIGTTNPGTYKLYVNGPSGGTGYWETSDIRLKKNVEPIGNALSLIGGLQGVRFDWDSEALTARAMAQVKQGDPVDAQIPTGIEGRQVGLIAQDVEKVLPELVKTDADGYKAMSYEKLTAVLLQAVKELKAEVEKLKGQ